ncbi:MAG: UvrD-helicase domain-containing protein [Candidatus Fermentibacteraceae bacterium]
MDPPDKPSRDRIKAETARSVVVEASAGTGKTTLLTERVANLVLREGIPLANLAVVTFTEAAAAELRVRIRAALQGQGGGMGAAWITTIHGFASRVLKEYPHLTNAYSDFTVETSHFTGREQRMLWDSSLSCLKAKDAAECMPALVNPGSEALRELASKLEPLRWIDDIRVFGDHSEALAEGRHDVLSRLTELAAKCADPSDLLYRQVASVLEPLARGGEFRSLGTIKCNVGKAQAWGGRETLDEVKAEVKLLNASLDRLRGIEAYAVLVPALEKIVIPCALSARRRWDSDKTRLSYDDLLHLAHAAVQQSPDLREALSLRFRHILIDEFQDTSLLQADLFLGFLSSCGMDGRLTIVGDPKQSIYGWRSADIETYRDTVDFVQREGALRETISTSFRSCRSVIGFVNAFGNALFEAVPDEEKPFLPEYSPLLPAPEAEAGPKPHVVRLPVPFDDGPAAGYKGRVQAEAVADILTGEKYGDWAVLFRAATRLEELVEALDSRNIPYTVEAGRDFKERPEVSDTAMLIRAVTDPGDRRAWVHTLRSLYFGLDDITLSLALTNRPTREVHEAEGVLRGLREAAANLSPGLFIETVFRTTCITEAVRESGFEVNRRLSNLRSILERARACQGMDQLLDVLGGTSSLSSEEPSASPESGESVTLSTIHRAKGLTWNNVILLNPGRGGSPQRTPLLTDPRASEAAVGLGEGKSPHFARLSAREKARTNAEFRRLLYVAVTRPRQRLVIFSDADEKLSGHALVLREALAGAAGFFTEETPSPLDLSSLHGSQSPSAFRPEPSFIVPNRQFPEAEQGAKAMRLGTEVHGLLEKIDLTSPETWLEQNLPLLRRGMEFPDTAAGLALEFFRTPLPFMLSNARVVGREYPLLSRGRIQYVDLLLDMGDHLEVIDFKTDSPGMIGTLMDEYRLKLNTYAETLEKVTGKPAACRLVLLQNRTCVTTREPSPPETRGGGRADQS